MTFHPFFLADLSLHMPQMKPVVNKCNILSIMVLGELGFLNSQQASQNHEVSVDMAAVCFTWCTGASWLVMLDTKCY